MEKTKSQIEKEAIAYLNKTSLHAFTTNDGYIYKVITFESEGKRYYATIMLGNGKVLINTKEVLSDRQFAYYGNNSLNVLKASLFPTWYKTTSIPNFKKLKALVADIQKEIKVDSKLNAELAEKIKTRLTELEQVK
jgi:predicted Zn-dependent peptidase